MSPFFFQGGCENVSWKNKIRGLKIRQKWKRKGKNLAFEQRKRGEALILDKEC